jgi:hypothetical protein
MKNKHSLIAVHLFMNTTKYPKIRIRAKTS